LIRTLPLQLFQFKFGKLELERLTRGDPHQICLPQEHRYDVERYYFDESLTLMKNAKSGVAKNSDINKLLEHLGISEAFIATQCPVDIEDFCNSYPGKVSGLAFIGPGEINAESFTNFKNKMMCLASQREARALQQMAYKTP
tara:strand:- start:180 stop:605 length:426 start_codon:yes stop_codon:yes gene_type:complete